MYLNKQCKKTNPTRTEHRGAGGNSITVNPKDGKKGEMNEKQKNRKYKIKYNAFRNKSNYIGNQNKYKT